MSIGDALYGDQLIRCNWIHLYKDDNELENYILKNMDIPIYFLIPHHTGFFREDYFD